MKFDAIKPAQKPEWARDLAVIVRNDTANLPHDFGKIREEKNHGWFW